MDNGGVQQRLPIQAPQPSKAYEYFMIGLKTTLVVLMTVSLFLIRFFINRLDLTTPAAKQEQSWMSEFFLTYGLFVVLNVVIMPLTGKAKEPYSTWLKVITMIGVIAWLTQSVRL